MLGTSGIGDDATKGSALTSSTGSKCPDFLSLDELIALRKTLRALKIAVENADEYVLGNDEQVESWTSFTLVGGRKITLPGEMMVELLREISARATKEVGVIEKKFKDWSVNPCSADES